MPAGVYLHIPFCKSRCSYCDFATDVYRTGDAVERYVAAICSEIAVFESPEGRTEIDTVYFGGGTPSLLAPAQVEKILDVVRERFDVREDVEVTMEMNPATVTPATLASYRELGVDRASFGVQTFDDRELKLLARGHDAADARRTFRMLREAGFGNISFDLIAGLPGQAIADWRKNLDEAIAMRPEHLSLYLLEIHEGTPLAEQIRSGRRPPPDEDLAAEMYEMMIDALEAEGYKQYEISNFARPGFASRHNTKYWRLDPVYGFGVSAHSFDGSNRYANERDTARYVASVERTGAAEVSRERIDRTTESIFLGLRLSEGIALDAYRRRFEIDLERTYGQQLARLRDSGLVEVAGDRLRLTRKGRVFSNEVFVEFV